MASGASSDTEKPALPNSELYHAPSALQKETLASSDAHNLDTSSKDASLFSAEKNIHVEGDPEKNHDDTEAQPEDDPNDIYWDGPEDPHNPMNFTRWRKGVTIGLVSLICFVTPLASSMFAPGVPQLMTEFNSNNEELASFVVSIYVLGFAVGPLILAPLSEIYGRLPVYHVCNICFLLWTIGCALATNLNMLIGFRLMAGIFGSAPLVNGGGTIADIIIQEKRGAAMAMFAMGPIIGPVS
jgi:hypothetical protein